MNCGAGLTNDSDQYYGPAAYRPQLIPDQRVQQQDLNHSTPGRSAGFRLPWGSTQDLMPSNLFARWRPEALRRIEEREDLLAEAGDQGQLDHESICYAPLAFRSKVVNAFELYGKAFFWVSLPLGLVTYLMHIYLTDSSFVAALNDVWPFIIALSGIPAAMWLSSTVAFTFFPRWCVKAGRGPEWELNRRTGVVRIWHYRRRIPLFWNYQETVTETPFYEFDGWVAGGATQYGPRFDFILCHRYSKLKVHIGDILLGWHQSPRPCYALWDFLQNYMDVTQPLPEFPVLEPHRSYN